MDKCVICKNLFAGTENKYIVCEECQKILNKKDTNNTGKISKDKVWGFNLTVGKTKYYVKCLGGYQRNTGHCSNSGYLNYGLQLSFIVKDLNTGKKLRGTQIKDNNLNSLSYKIRQYIINSINGQRQVSFDYDLNNENGKVHDA